MLATQNSRPVTDGAFVMVLFHHLGYLGLQNHEKNNGSSLGLKNHESLIRSKNRAHELMAAFKLMRSGCSLAENTGPVDGRIGGLKVKRWPPP